MSHRLSSVSAGGRRLPSVSRNGGRMVRGGFQLSGEAAQMYEEQKVPTLFGPLAAATFDRYPVAPDDVVLDVACGTGIVARTIRARFGEEPRVVGADLNDTMIAAARRASERDDLSIEWHVCDAATTPFADAMFTFVVCQQGLQFFPDEDSALSEFRRVARDGARLVFTIWSRPSPLMVALADSLRRHAGGDLAEEVLTPFSWRGVESIVSRLHEVGFVDVELDEFAVDRVLTDPFDALPREIFSSPVGARISGKGEAFLDAVVEEMLDSLRSYRVGDRLVIPQHTHIASAVAR